MNRRNFLQLLGLGAAAAASPTILIPEPEPVRRYWQVPRNAPVGGSPGLFSSDLARAFRDSIEQALVKNQADLDRYVEASMRNGYRITVISNPASAFSGWIRYSAGAVTSDWPT